MKFISLQENLKRGLNTVGHITSKNINLPILSSVLIRALDGNLELISTNLEIGIVYRLRGKVEVDGEVAVDSKLVSEYVSLLKGDDKVLVDSDENNLKIESGVYKTTIKGELSKDFPLIPTIPRKNKYSCKVLDFRKALNRVVFAVSNNENRTELTGVLFSFNGPELTLAATDSYRLAEKILEVRFFSDNELGDVSENKLIVPAKTVQELLRILNNLNEATISEDEVIDIYTSENQILFIADSMELISRLINGQYPDYKQIIPNQIKTTSTTDKQELVRATKAAALFSRTGINDITLKFSKNKIVVSASSSASGESRTEVDASTSGDENEITINFKYLLDGLNNIDSPNVKISLINSNTPCLLEPEKNDKQLYIVMPIHQ